MLVENGRPIAGQKKLVIKGLKQRPTLPANFELGTWEKLRAAVLAVQHAEAVGSSLEDLYQAVESMCVHKLSEALYNRLQHVCNAHIEASLADMAQHVSKDSVAFLTHMDACWNYHCEQMLLIRSIFLYLDRSFVVPKAEPRVRGIYDMGLQQFRRHFEAQSQVSAKVIEGVLHLLRAHRAHEALDAALLKSMITMLRDLGLYRSAFLQPFLDDTQEIYAQEGLGLLASSTVPQHLLHAEQRLAEEATRCTEFLEPETLAPLLEVVRTQLLGRHFSGLLSRGLGELLAEHRLNDLARLYRLSGLIGATDELQLRFKEWVRATGMALVTDPEKDGALVQGLLDLKQRTTEVLQGPCQGAESFNKAVREAFEKFVNQRENKPAELIAKFLDSKLRAGNKAGGTDAQLEEQLDRVLVLFRYIQGKDIFEAFYKKDFAKRLLMAKSASIDVEKSMIAKLKAECGAQYTSKLEGMFKDEQISKDIAIAFKSCADSQAQLPAGLDVNVRVLTSGFWPSYPMVEAKLPDELNRSKQVFEKYYLAKHSGRRLTWHSSLEQCTLRAAFPKDRSKAIKHKELQVSLHQVLALLLFNDVDSLTFEEVRAATGLPDAEMRRTLQSLACGKVRVLTKEPLGKEVNDGDVFHYNADFQHNLIKIKINQIQLKETAEENKKTNEQVLQDRQYQIDAAIVRTMKARKQLSHKLLVNEVMLQLKFNIKAVDLKKRIENLIEREYLERAPESLDVYNYLA